MIQYAPGSAGYRQQPTLPPVGTNGVSGARAAGRIVTIAIAVVLFLAAVLAGTLATGRGRALVSASGVLEPAAVWQVFSPVAGRVVRVDVHSRDVVHRGEPLAFFDSDAAVAALADRKYEVDEAVSDWRRAADAMPVDQLRARAALEAADAKVLGARANLRGVMVQYRTNGDPDSIARASSFREHVGLDVPSAALLSAIADDSTARAGLSAADLDSLDITRKAAATRHAEDQFHAARASLARLTMRSPANGVVISGAPELLVGRTFAQGEMLFEVADTSAWHVVLLVGESDIYRLQLGDSVAVQVTAFASLPSNRFDGAVTAIGWQPIESANGQGPPVAVASPRMYRVEVLLTANDALREFRRDFLHRGFLVRATIVLRSERLIDLIRAYLRQHLNAR